MKFAVILISVTFWACSQNRNTTHNLLTDIKVEDDSLDLKKIYSKKEYQIVFSINNTGDIPLTIYQVDPTCGCTKVKFSQKPIKPGDTGIIHVLFKADYPGRFHKQIKLYANIEQSPLNLTFFGEALE